MLLSFQVIILTEKCAVVAENGDTEESREAGACVLYFKESTSEHFTFIAKLKDPEAL